MNRSLRAILCVTLGILLLPGCGLVSRAVSAVNNALRTAPAPSLTVYQSTETPQETLEAIKTQTPLPASTAAPETASPPAPSPSAAPTALSGNRSGITMGELMEYFNEVVFGGDAGHALLKWADPIVVSLSGKFDQQDSDTLTTLLDTLNEYDGFPGATFASASAKSAKPTLEIKLVSADTLAKDEPNWSGKSPCYAAYWYHGYEIYKGLVYIVPDMETTRADRNCDLAWGLFYTLGFVNNSKQYVDGLFNPDYYGDALGSSFQGPCAADWFLVSMLYGKAVKPGMTFEEAKAALSGQ